MYSQLTMHVEGDRRGAILIDIARREIGHSLGLKSERGDDTWAEETWLREPGAVFVTLEVAGHLRGCIGSLIAERSLIEDVRANAIAAATRDPRFPSIEAQELADLVVEVTELSAPKPMRFTSEADALAQLRPGEDGVVLHWGGRRATFLPQVWDSLPEPRLFLAQLKRKAGLEEDFWDDSIELERYRARKWSDS